MTIPPDAESDEQLIARTRAGDMNAYDELYRRHVDDATRVARIVTNHSDEAQDVVAEAFTRVLTRLREGGGPDAELTPYLRTVVRRLAIDRHRSSQRSGAPADPAVLDVLPRPDDPMGRATDNRLVRDAFETLPERWQQVLWHTEIEGRSPASLAPALGASANAVAALAYRAREGLRQAYLAVNLSAEVRPECRPYAPKVASYVRGTLSAADTREMTAHLAQCEHCRERRDELLLLVSDMRGVLWPALLLPASGAVAAVAAGAGGAAAGGGILAFLNPASWGQRAKHLVAGGAAAAAAGIIAATAYVMVNDDDPPPAAAPTTSSQPEDPGPAEQPQPPAEQPPAEQPPAEPPAQEPPAAAPPAPSPEPPPSPAPQPPSPEPSAEPAPTQPPASPSPSPSPTPPPETPPPSPEPSPSPTPPPPPPPPPPPAEEPPSVEQQPPANPVAAAGEPLTLRVQVSGNPKPSLQWQYANPPAAPPVAAGPTRQVADAARVSWIDVEGETSETLVIPELTPEHNGRSYRVLATNALGTIATKPSVLNVRYAPAVTADPQHTQADEGDAVVLSASAIGNPAQLTVAWQSRAPGGEWAAASGDEVRQGVTSTLELTGVGPELHEHEFRAVFGNELGEAVTKPATLTVRWAPKITEDPVDAEANIGADAEFTASASANPAATWHWERASGVHADWTPIPGSEGGPGETASLTLSDVTLEDDGTRYRAVFTNELTGETGVPTAPAELTVVRAGRLEVVIDGAVRCVLIADEELRAGDCANSPATAWAVPGDGTLRWVAEDDCLDIEWPLIPIEGGKFRADIMLFNCFPNPNQQWLVDADDPDAQRIESAGVPNHCLDIEGVSPTGRLILYPCHGGVNQQFRFVPPTPIDDGNAFARAVEQVFG